ncbi:SMI1/KNR4 family protein [Pseudanabaenaceae cyanobacterium LEGE 13415]|nr:SMI1/KNR4 family protein [Pseudanabaenaceae cyanobacterium LEGE 13415]
MAFVISRFFIILLAAIFQLHLFRLKHMSNSWHELMQTLQFEGENASRNPSEEVIAVFEQEHKITLSSDYKEFCELFGSGCFGNTLDIYCPGNSQLLLGQERLQLIINNIREFSSGDAQLDDEKIDLLSNGFWIGIDSSGYCLICDLGTYCDEDSSYDLYWVQEDCPESESLECNVYYAGRSFFELFRDFCNGLRINPCLKPSYFRY